MEDKLLILRCRRGSRDALGRIYAKYKDDLLILAVALLNDTGSAEDVVHDVFLSFVRDIDKFRLTGSLKGYLMTCAANCARNKKKAKHRRNVGLDAAASVSAGSNDPPASIICSEELHQLGDALAQLPYEQREAIILHLQAAMTFRAIAKTQGISVNTAKSRFRYGLNKIRSIFGEEYRNETGRQNKKTD